MRKRVIPMIECRNVYKFLGKKQVLQDVNLEIQDGTIFGLIGPNGAGKSTLLRMLAGIYQCDGGQIVLDNERIFDHPDSKRQILFISDEPFQFFHASLKDMKEFYQDWYPVDERLYHHYLELFHLDENKPLKNFSKGMKRQAFILLGLAASPRYLLLDEAFDGLDPMMRHHFKNVISERIADQKMSVIIASHDLKEMEALCDTFAMLEKGTVRTSGALDHELAKVHRIQLAFDKVVEPELFHDMDIVTMQIRSRVVNLYVRGEVEKIEAYLQTLNPLVMEILPVNLEEMFIQEVLHDKEGLV